jgi:glycosyltransferase involved in cell wall biosynthesis
MGADMLVNPSLSEGLPNIVLEAMALDVPVVATAVGGVPELVQDGRSGLLLPPSDPLALSAAILRLAEHPALGRTLSQSASKIIEESFSFDKQAILLKGIYERVASGHS